MIKECFKCGEERDISLFYKHSQMADGHLGKCKECAKKDVTEHRNKNIERIRAYDRKRGKLPHRIKRCVQYNRKYRKDFPLRNAARTILNNAVRDGKITKPKNCSMCKKGKRIYGHHNDYYKPLKVIWCCQVCHKQLHKAG